jgi:hypothetical protein
VRLITTGAARERMDFSRKHCDKLEDGEVPDDEHVGRALGPTAASSTERAQYQPPVSLADFKCPLPDADKIELLRLHFALCRLDPSPGPRPCGVRGRGHNPV